MLVNIVNLLRWIHMSIPISLPNPHENQDFHANSQIKNQLHISINGAPTNFLTHTQFGVEAHFGVYYANFLTYTTLSHFHFWAQAHFGTQASTFLIHNPNMRLWG